MPKKIRELKAMLLKASFTYRQGKGSHTNWTQPSLANVIAIARKDREMMPRSI
jgi:hypothetical protein